MLAFEDFLRSSYVLLAVGLDKARYDLDLGIINIAKGLMEYCYSLAYIFVHRSGVGQHDGTYGFVSR